jgi:hypothetical protein
VKRIVKIVLGVLGGIVGVVVIGGGAFVGINVSRYNSSMDKVYEVPVPKVERSTDPAVLARGKHLVESIAGCGMGDCHGADTGGGKSIPVGPLGLFTAPNITAGGLGAAYSDGELFRVVRNGLKKDGRSLRFMPAHEISWLPDSDITALVSYLRTLPPVQKPNGPMEIGTMAKVLDRFDMIVVDVARRINHEQPELAPPPTPDASYGRFLGKLCTGCHGATFGGGPIPGAPPELPIPLNITPDASGLKGWTFEDFDKLLMEGMRKNGKKLDPFMPVQALSKMDETEKKALWAYLQSLPPKPFGAR